MFHFDKDMKDLESDPYGLRENVMYRDHQDNPLINDFGMYVLSRLYTFQNMREAFRVTADTNIEDYVRHYTELLDGHRVYRFSRELLAYLETLVAFTPYHVANDPYAAAPMDNFYVEALRRYQRVPYPKLHDYIAEGLTDWYKQFKPDASAADAKQEEHEEHEACDEGGGVEDNRAGDDVAAPTQTVSFSLTRKGRAPAPAAAAAAAAPDPAPAAAAAASAAGAAVEESAAGPR
jgi:hypothetical protein